MTHVVFIMTDNQGAWSLGCYGNDEIRTPHIDALAADGVRCANVYKVNSVCSPSRATFFTGLIPSQHGVHCYLGSEKPDSHMGPEAYCTIDEFVTLPQLLHQFRDCIGNPVSMRGYASAVSAVDDGVGAFLSSLEARGGWGITPVPSTHLKRPYTSH